MRRICFRAFSVLVVLATSAVQPCIAAAQTDAPPSAAPLAPDVVARANTLFREANKLYTKKQYEEAEKGFLAAWALNPTYDVAANLGHTEFRLGKPRAAAEYLAFALRTFPLTGSAKGRKAAQNRLDELRKLVVSVTVQVSAARAEVFVDGSPAGVSPLLDELFLDPGPRTIEAKLAGYETAKQTIPGEQGSAPTVTLTLVPSPPPTVKAPLVSSAVNPASPPHDPGLGNGAALPPVPPPAVTPPAPRSLVPGIVLGAAGAVAAGAGVALLVVSGGKKSDGEEIGRQIDAAGGYCTTPSAAVSVQCGELHTLGKDSARLHNVGIGVFVGAGVALAAAGTYLLWPSSAPKAPLSMTAAPMVALGGGGLLVQGSF